MIDPYPRYRNFSRCATTAAIARACRRGRRRFSIEDIRDLQVWHKLVWIDPIYFEQDGRISRLVAKGRGFHRRGQGHTPGRRAGDHAAGDTGVRGGCGARTGRALHVALLSSNPAAPLRHGRVPADPPALGACREFRSVIPKTLPISSRGPSRSMNGCSASLRAGLWPSEGSVSDAMVPLVRRAGLQLDGDRRGDPGRRHAGSRSRATRDGTSPRTRGALSSVRVGGRKSSAVGVRIPRPSLVRSHRIQLCVLARRERRRRFRRADGGSGRVATPSARAGKKPPSSSSSTERMPGSIRGAGPAVPARSVFQTRVASGASDGHDVRSVRRTHRAAAVHLPGVLDQRRFLHLDGPRRRPSGMESARRRSPGA